MLVYLDQAYDRIRTERGEEMNVSDLRRAVVAGAVERVRPKMMTVLTTLLGLAPIMWGHGIGSQTMKRIAAPMVGGVASSALLTLIVIPAVYALWKGRSLKDQS